MRHYSVEQWEVRLDQMMQELDHILEERFQGAYYLHPARPARGEAANPTADGLFSITAAFTLGLGSKLGKGYVLDIRLATLESVSVKVRREIEAIALENLTALLPQYFPNQKLNITQDGDVLKIHGDLSLGTV
ncbi:MAG: hypothetical protein EHM72_16210 [Calditrichaeota bacterium]|nr:MAG: hypothetical protein EHM72_16210 [Calditrichota bacterium]